MLSSLLLAALFLSNVAHAKPVLPQKRASVAFFDPRPGGGSMLDSVGGGLGEPLNVIVSGLSDENVLVANGFLNYVRSLGFSDECLDLHSGAPQQANLGDGHGFVNQSVELRQDFGAAALGTCVESLIGGNHLRVFIQDGPTADSGALFLAVSHEEDLAEGHTIEPNGYNIGRNEFVAAAIAGPTTQFGVTYQTTAENITGLATPGSAGVNHGIAIDGIVTLITVKVISG